MHVCVCLGLYEARTHCDCCGAMHACVGVCVWVCTRLELTCDCCEAMHACVGLCMWACTSCMLTVIAVR